MNLFIRFIFIIISSSIFISCSSLSDRTDFIESENKPDEKIIADAYLFDAKLIQNKKVTSVRLEFYRSDNYIGINGRGYLGKGALKGHLSPDSLKVYFPVANEFVDESVERLFQSFSCEGEIGRFEISSLFKMLPEDILTDESFQIEILEAAPKRRAYRLSVKSCQWAIDLVYDKRHEQWLIRNFSFSDGKATVLKGKRREFKPDVKVKISRFRFNPPTDAARIIP